LHITRFLSLTEPQFQGCRSAFVDSLTGELNSTVLYLRKLDNQRKGGAFAYEMSLDQHRYRALVVLDRWATLVRTFAGSIPPETVEATPARVAAAEELITRANQIIDAGDFYTLEAIEACQMAYQAVSLTFAAERQAAEQNEALGPMLPEEYRQARRIFLEDLAAR
jgi:hypothetical protein